jgi:hypothetical protein
MSPRIKSFAAVAILLAVFIGVALVVQRLHILAKPETVMAAFFASNSPEALQADVLILAGRKMEKTVLDQLLDENAPKRRYMLVYLSSIGSTNSISALHKIAANPNEPAYLRIEALQCLFLIDTDDARQLAKRHSQNNDELGVFASALLAGNAHFLHRRTFGDAFWCRDVESR